VRLKKLYLFIFLIKVYDYLGWEIEKSYLKLLEWVYYKKQPDFFKLFHTQEKFDIYIIAYGNPKIIELLIKTYSLSFRFKYNLFIFDNSVSSDVRSEIFKVCSQHRVNYIGLPRHSKNFKSSQSHAIAINWVLKFYSLKRNVKYYAFLDHDIFPLKEISMNDLFQGYGISGILIPAIKRDPKNFSLIIQHNYSYLWPGMLFFRHEYLYSFRKINFMPFCYNGYQFDTGGKTYFYLKELNSEEVRYFPSNRKSNLQGIDFDLVDDKWLHTLSGSNWRNLSLGDNYEVNLLKSLTSER